MALILPTLGQMSGSVAGNTFAHNRFGMYVRHRATPVNPKTSPQTIVRNSLGIAAQRWQNELTQAERDAWNSYAFSVTRTNSLGQTYNPSGWQLFVGLIAWAQRSGLAFPTVTAPTDPGAAQAVVAWAATDTVNDTAAATNPQSYVPDYSALGGWDADTDDDRLMIQIGRQQSPGVFFYNGPWTWLGTVVGDSVTPPTDTPITINQTLEAGNVIWVRYSHVDPLRRMAPGTTKRLVIVTN